ncbi:MAG: hypothetical protein M9938_06570 [Solirubrobacterales bacterium]|nr:hypothetical protein [Solirubrobacterales bacterium]
MNRTEDHRNRKVKRTLTTMKGDRVIRRTVLAGITAILLGFGFTAPALATVPGNNGLIAFSSTRDGNAEIYTATRTGVTVERLTNDAAADTHPAFSPNGAKIAFTSDRDGDREIYVMDADGTNPTRITNNVGDDMDATWSPDGTRLAIRRDIGSNNEIFLVDAADGGNPVNLTNDAASDFEPEFSPDGSRIAFQRYTSGVGVGFGNEVMLMDADGSNQVNLTGNVNTINDGRPSFAPGGSRIAFDSNRNDGRFEIYTMALDGSDVTRLTNSAENKQNSAYSPAGDLIAFNAGGIGLVPSAGGATTAVTSDPDITPSWSTDSDVPTTNINGGPAEGSTTNATTADFTFGASEPESTFECRIDSSQAADWAACTSPQQYTGLTDGSHTFEVRATDLGGNVEAIPDHRTWTVDATAPTVTIDSGPTGVVATQDATIAFTVDDNTATVECRLDSNDVNDWAACASPKELTGLTDGDHTLEVRATDPVGNVSPVASRTWTVDTTPPTTTIDSTPTPDINDGKVHSIRATFEFSANEPGSSFECRIDSNAPEDWTPCSSPAGYTGLADTSHSFEVRATDPVGNVGAPASHTWEVLTVKPNATIDTGPNGAVNSSDATFEFSSDLGSATFECRIDSSQAADWAACTSPKQYTGLADGSHTFEVRATDLDQGTGPVADRQWTVDTDAPTVTIDSGPTGAVATQDATIAFTVDDNTATVECRLDSNDVNDWAACASPKELTGLAEGDHTLEVRATDAAGNEGTASRTWTVDTIAPVVSIDSTPTADINDGMVHSIRAAFEFSATDQTAVSFECRIDSSDENDWAACNSPQSYDQLTDGSHGFELRGTDAAGNSSGVASHTWQVLTDPPVVTISNGPADPTAADSASFDLSIDPVLGVDYSQATYQCRIDSVEPGDWTACSSPAPYSSLTDGQHNLQVRAVDPDQGTGPISGWTWTVDTTDPTVELTGTPAPISGTADPEFAFTATDATATTAECRLDSTDVNDWAACSSPKSYLGLSEGEHTFEVRVTDAVGHVSATESYTWIVETTPPTATITSTAPENPTTFIEQTFSFNSTNQNAYFECRFDGSAWSTCTSPVTHDQLTDAEHTFEVRAVGHGAGPGPVASQIWTVDTVVPTLRITSGPDEVTNQTDADFTLAMNKPGFDLECRLDSSAPGDWVPCDSATSQQYSGLPAGDHWLDVRALDPNSNEVDRVSWDWSILANPPAATLDWTPPALTASSTATVSFSSDVSAASFECSLDGGSFSRCTSPAAFTGLADGSHTVAVRATLPGGPAGPVAEATWESDTTAPDVLISGGPNGTVTADSAAFTVTVDDPDANTECRLDDAAWAACGGVVNLTGLGDGEHHFRVRSTDDAGNTGTGQRTWNVDRVTPTVTITEAPAATTTDRNAGFDFTASKAGVTFDCRVDGGEWQSCSPVVTLNELKLGPHSFEVRATDRHGNQGSAASHGWTVIRVPYRGLVPTVKIRKRVKLNRDGDGLLARINCPEAKCRVTAPKRVTFRIKGRKFRPGLKVVRNAFEGKTTANLISSAGIRKRIAKAGPVRIKVRITVRSENGKSRTVTAKVTLVAR